MNQSSPYDLLTICHQTNGLLNEPNVMPNRPCNTLGNSLSKQLSCQTTQTNQTIISQRNQFHGNQIFRPLVNPAFDECFNHQNRRPANPAAASVTGCYSTHTNHRINSIIQSLNEAMNHPTDQPLNQPSSALMNQASNNPLHQRSNQSTNQPTNQPVNQ